MFHWLLQEKEKAYVNVSFKYRRAGDLTKNNDLIRHIKDPRHVLFPANIIRFFMEGEIIFLSFFEINWSVEQQLFFLDYQRVLNYYIHILISRPKYFRGAELLLHAWDRGCSSLSFSRVLFAPSVVLEPEFPTYVAKFKDLDSPYFINFTRGLESLLAYRRSLRNPMRASGAGTEKKKPGSLNRLKNSLTAGFEHCEFVTGKLFDFFSIGLSTNVFLLERGGILSSAEEVATIKTRLKYIKDWNALDLFYLRGGKELAEKLNFWFISHMAILSTSFVTQEFFNEVYELIAEFHEDFYSVADKNFTDLEDELLNSFESLLDDQEHKRVIAHRMRILLELDKQTLGQPPPSQAYYGRIPSFPVYYGLLKGYEVMDLLQTYSWDVRKLAAFYEHVLALDSTLYELVVFNRSTIWARYKEFCTTMEYSLQETMAARWYAANFIFGSDNFLDIQNYFFRKGWFAEEIYLPNLKKFVIAIWAPRERRFFLGRHLYMLNFTVLDLEVSEDAKAAVLSSIANIHSILETNSRWTAAYSDIWKKYKPKPHADMMLLVYNRKLLRRMFRKLKKRKAIAKLFKLHIWKILWNRFFFTSSVK